jgi:D-glycero-alpha-D-manno-heptose-7-phosphate kinase
MARRSPAHAPFPEPTPLEAFAPARVDLAGGTLDLWPLYCLHPGSITVNAALASGVRIRLLAGGAPPGAISFSAPGRRPRLLDPGEAGRDLAAAVGFHLVPGGGFAVEVVEQPPIGSGLGASSAFAVALARGCLALAGRRLPPARIVALLRDLESRVLGVPTGVQDYWPALVGGALALHLEPGGERIERLGTDPNWLAERLVVLYSGITHASGMVNWQVYRARLDGNRRVARRLDEISAAAAACRVALLAGDEAAVGRAITAEWRARRELAPSVTNPALDAILAAGTAAGARAGKACGAGGGGSVMFWVAPRLRGAVRAAALAVAPGAFEVVGGFAARGATVRSRRVTMARNRG